MINGRDDTPRHTDHGSSGTACNLIVSLHLPIDSPPSPGKISILCSKLNAPFTVSDELLTITFKLQGLGRKTSRLLPRNCDSKCLADCPHKIILALICSNAPKDAYYGSRRMFTEEFVIFCCTRWKVPLGPSN